MASAGEDDVSGRVDFTIHAPWLINQVFERLKNKTDLAEQKRQQDELNARLYAQQHKSQERLGELVGGQLVRQELLLKFWTD